MPVFPVNGPGEALSPGIPVSAIGQEEWNFGPTLEPEFAYVYADEVASGARKSGESSKSNSGTEDKEKRKDRQRRRAETAPLMEDEAQKIAMPHVRSRTEQPGPSHTRGPSGERGMPLERAQWHQDVADSAASPRASSGSPAQPNGQRAAMGAAQGYASPQRQSSEWSQSLNTTPRAPQAATMTPMNTASSGATARAIQADIRSDSPADDWSHPQQQQQQQPFSSADIYAPRPNSALSVLGAGNGNAGGSRPGTSLSMLSADQYSGDGDPKRSSYSTSASGAGNAKRASVLSFQTALSGHVMDGLLNADEAGRLSRSSQRPGDQEEMFEEVQDAPEQNAWSAPWTYGGGGGVDAQDGWRSGVPGGWTDRNDAMPGAAMAEAGPPALPPKSEQQKRWSQLQRQAAGAPEVLAPPRESHSRDPSGVGPGPPKLRADTDVPRLAELAASSPFGLDIPASSTVGPSSSDSDTALPGRGPSTALVSSHAEQAVSPEARLTLPQPHARQDTTVAQENALAPTSVALVPLPPSPLAPPVPTKDDTLEVPELGNKEPASPVFSDSVIPPPLPAEVVAQQGDQQLQVVAPPTNAPVSDFRARPLANISPATQTAGLEQLQAQKDQLISGHEDEAEDVDEAPRAPSESIDTPPREPSPPPDGEVEARAEWERAQMKQKQGRDEGPRKPSFRTQLKPLQLVPADSEGQTSVLRRPASTMSFPSPRLESATATGTPDESSPLQTVAAKALGQGGREQGAAQATGSPTSQMSTQQLQQHLQRQQAREQRRSVGALSMNMGGTETLTAGGNNGPYPIFPSPTTAASKPGAQRQYPGLMPQRSLVPPFELQQRPDGLPSGLTGPDGVRRSPNDPEVCLECMMRDEDMIDVHVVGPGLWERESDREFEDAKRIEEEEEARDRDRETSGASVLGSTTPSREGGEALSASHAHSYAGSSRETAPSQSQSRANVKLRVRKVGRGDPLTADRLKLHTQMVSRRLLLGWSLVLLFADLLHRLGTLRTRPLRLIAGERFRPSLRSRPNTSRWNSERGPKPIVSAGQPLRVIGNGTARWV